MVRPTSHNSVSSLNWRSKLRQVCTLATLLSIAALWRPAGAQDLPTFSSNVKVVNVPATVRTKHGDIVRDLNKEDFSLVEDGRPQVIKYFTKENDLPLSLGLLIDISGSQRRLIGAERSASYTFLQQVLREDRDKAFIIHFEGDVELLQDLTSSRQKLEEALDHLADSTDSTRRAGSGGGRQGGGWPGGGGGWPGGGGGRRGVGHFGGGTALYDAVFLASDEVINQQQGRKALIILSDGVDNASRVPLERAIESAQRADTMVYAILFADSDAYGGGFGGMGGGWGRRGGYPRFPQQSTTNGKKVLERIAKETGARMFEVSKKLPIEQIYAQIQEELRNQYSLGYTPDHITGGYHKIRVETHARDLIVQARDGYYAR
jgi:VWFA-related protein